MTWKTYQQFKQEELAAGYPQDAFVTLIPRCVESVPHANILFAFFDLIASIATHGKRNGLGGRKLARLMGTWAFDIKKPNAKDSTSFADGLAAWSVASEAANHLFFAFLRSLSPVIPTNGGPMLKTQAMSKFPRPLETLLVSTTYPPPPIYKSRLITVPMVTLTVGKLSANPLVLLRRVAKTIRFDNPELFDCEDDFNTLYFLFSDPSSVESKMTPESLRITKEIMRENPLVSDHKLLIKETPKFSFDVRGKTWSRHYNHAFVDPATGELRRPLTNYVYDEEQLREISKASAPRQEIPNLPYPIDEDELKGKKRQDSDDWSSFRGFEMSRPPRPSSRISADGLVTAAVSQIAIDDFFVWVWMSCNSDEQTEVRKANFGRSIIVEVELTPGDNGRRWVVIEEILHPEPPPIKPPHTVVDRPLEKIKKRSASTPVREKPKKREKGKRVAVKKNVFRQTPVPPPRHMHQFQQPQQQPPPISYQTLDPLVEALAKRLQRQLSIKDSSHLSHDMQTQTEPVDLPDNTKSDAVVSDDGNSKGIQTSSLVTATTQTEIEAATQTAASEEGQEEGQEIPPAPPPKEEVPVLSIPVVPSLEEVAISIPPKEEDARTVFFTPVLDASDTAEEPPLPDLPSIYMSPEGNNNASPSQRNLNPNQSRNDSTEAASSPLTSRDIESPGNRRSIQSIPDERRISMLIPEPVHVQSRQVSLEDKPLPATPSEMHDHDGHTTDDLNYYLKSQATDDYEYDGLLSHDDLKFSSQNNSNRNSSNMGSSNVGSHGKGRIAQTKLATHVEDSGDLAMREPLTIYKNPKRTEYGQSFQTTTSESDLSEIAPKWKPIEAGLSSQKQLSVKRRPVGSGATPKVTAEESPKLNQEQADLAKDINQLVGSEVPSGPSPVPRPRPLVRQRSRTLDDPRGSKMFGGYDSTGNQIVGLGVRSDANRMAGFLDDSQYPRSHSSSDFPSDFRGGSERSPMGPYGSGRQMPAYKGPQPHQPPNFRPPYLDEQGRRLGGPMRGGQRYPSARGRALDYGKKPPLVSPGSGYFAGSSNGSTSPDLMPVSSRPKKGDLRHNLDSFVSPHFGRDVPGPRRPATDDAIGGSVPLMHPRFPQRNMRYRDEFGPLPSSGPSESRGPYPMVGPRPDQISGRGAHGGPIPGPVSLTATSISHQGPEIGSDMALHGSPHRGSPGPRGPGSRGSFSSQTSRGMPPPHGHYGPAFHSGQPGPKPAPGPLPVHPNMGPQPISRSHIPESLRAGTPSAGSGKLLESAPPSSIPSLPTNNRSSSGSSISASLANKPLPLNPRWSEVKSNLQAMREESEKKKSRSKELLPVVPDTDDLHNTKNAHSILTGNHAPDDYYDAVAKTVRNPSVHTGDHVKSYTVERDPTEDEDSSAGLSSFTEFMYLRNKELLDNFNKIPVADNISSKRSSRVKEVKEAESHSSSRDMARHTTESSRGSRARALSPSSDTPSRSETVHTYGSFLDLYDDAHSNGDGQSGHGSSLYGAVFDPMYAGLGNTNNGSSSNARGANVSAPRTLDPKRQEEKVSRLSIQGIMNAAKNRKK